MAELPSYDLQMKAADERRRLHNSVTELRSRVRDEFGIKKMVRARLGRLCAIAAVLAIGTGYLLAGPFVRR